MVSPRHLVRRPQAARCDGDAQSYAAVCCVKSSLILSPPPTLSLTSTIRSCRCIRTCAHVHVCACVLTHMHIRACVRAHACMLDPVAHVSHPRVQYTAEGVVEIVGEADPLDRMPTDEGKRSVVSGKR